MRNLISIAACLVVALVILGVNPVKALFFSIAAVTGGYYVVMSGMSWLIEVYAERCLPNLLVGIISFAIAGLILCL